MIDSTAYSLSGRQLNVGLSSIIGVTVSSGVISTILKHSSGGTLWIGGASLGWGTNGYLVTANEALSLKLSGTFYLAAAGATVVTWVLQGFSPSDNFGG